MIRSQTWPATAKPLRARVMSAPLHDRYTSPLARDQELIHELTEGAVTIG